MADAAPILESPAIRREFEGADNSVPLVVDLEGTLVRCDLVLESLMILLRQRPFRFLIALWWVIRGRVYFKRRLAEETTPDIPTLPYDRSVIVYLEKEKRQGRRLVLISDAAEKLTKEVADYVGLFAQVVLVDDRTKRDRLVAEFHVGGFDYVGNRPSDQAVWAAAREAILARPENGLRRKVEKTTKVARVLDDRHASIRNYLGALRPHQWVKNTLVFVPLIAGDHSLTLDLLSQAVLAFVAFSLCASSGYIINDLLDIPSDRHHPRKKDRPLASGQLSEPYAMALAPLLLLAGMTVALLLPRPFLVALSAYYGLTVVYSLRLKELAILDVVTLAVLYTLRLAGGALAVGLPQSPWLLVFSIFFFLSLAMVKRYAELSLMYRVDGRRAHARAYVIEDRGLIAALGGTSGYLAVFVLGLWTATHDSSPAGYQFLWLDCLLLLYWITRIWLFAHRGRMNDDPLVFALRDKVSICVLLVMAAILMGARLS